MEIVPGIHRIESDLGPRFMCQFLFVGSERTLLFDTGISRTPADVIAPYLESIDMTLDDIDDVVNSHADVDHMGGNRLLRERNPRARFHCHEIDRHWIESNAAMLSENYSWHRAYGFPEMNADDHRWMTTELGGDSPIDLGLSGGETVRLDPEWRVDILHLPGHTMGHLAIWDARSGAAVIIDAVLETGIYDRRGNRLIPPRYYDARAYQATIRRLISLRPNMLLTAHYNVMEGSDAVAWLERGLQYTYDLHDVVREGIGKGLTGLWELTQYADKRVGPYPEFMTELGASVRAHMSLPGSPVT